MDARTQRGASAGATAAFASRPGARRRRMVGIGAFTAVLAATLALSLPASFALVETPDEPGRQASANAARAARAGNTSDTGDGAERNVGKVRVSDTVTGVASVVPATEESHEFGSTVTVRATPTSTYEIVGFTVLTPDGRAVDVKTTFSASEGKLPESDTPSTSIPTEATGTFTMPSAGTVVVVPLTRGKVYYARLIHSDNVERIGTEYVSWRYGTAVFFDGREATGELASANKIDTPIERGLIFNGYLRVPAGVYDASTRYINADGAISPLLAYVAEDIVLHPDMRAGEVAYRVNHWMQTPDESGPETHEGKTYELSSYSATYSATSGTAVTHPYLTAADIGDGFILPAKIEGIEHVGAGDEINYYYDRVDYDVELSAGQGVEQVAGAGAHRYGSSVTLEATLKAGYEWSGWQDASAAGGIAAPDEEAAYVARANPWQLTLAGPLSLTAVAEPRTYCALLDEQGGSGESDVTGIWYKYEQSGFYRESSCTTALSDGCIPVPTRENFVFEGYYEQPDGEGACYVGRDGAILEPLSSVLGTHTLYAKWSVSPQYHSNYLVHFDGNGGEGSMDDQQLTYNEGGQLAANAYRKVKRVTYELSGGALPESHPNTYDEAEMPFVGWADSPSGPAVYENRATVKNLAFDGTKVLYAVWGLQSAPLPTPTRAGYTFKGWGVTSSATSGSTGSYTFGEDVTIYATWEELPHEHAFAPTKTSGSCETGLVVHYRCDECGEEKDETLAPKPHTYASVRLASGTAANSTTVEWLACSVCGEQTECGITYKVSTSVKVANSPRKKTSYLDLCSYADTVEVRCADDGKAQLYFPIDASDERESNTTSYNVTRIEPDGTSETFTKRLTDGYLVLDAE